MATDGQGRQVICLAQFGNELHRVARSWYIFAVQAQCVDTGKADTQKNCIMGFLQFGQTAIAAQCPALPQCDSANLQQPVHFGLCKPVRRLVGGDAVFVQPARFFALVKDGYIMAVHRQPVRTGQSRWPRTHNGNMFASGAARV